MRSPISRCWVVVAAVLVAGCPAPEIEIEVARTGDRLTATLAQDRGWFRGKQVPCVREAALFEGAGPRFQAPVWRIEAEGGRCRDLGNFVIGEAPAGFSETVAFAAVPGRSYRLSVLGIGSGETVVRL